MIAGLRSGRLGDTLSRFSEYVAIGSELEYRRLWLSLAYPILTVGTASRFFFVCVILVGQFESIYISFNIPLPGMTVALISVARIVTTVWAPTASSLRIIVAFSWLAGRLFLTPPIRRARGPTALDRSRLEDHVTCRVLPLAPLSWKADCPCPKPSG